MLCYTLLDDPYQGPAHMNAKSVNFIENCFKVKKLCDVPMIIDTVIYLKIDQLQSKIDLCFMIFLPNLFHFKLPPCKCLCRYLWFRKMITRMIQQKFVKKTPQQII